MFIDDAEVSSARSFKRKRTTTVPFLPPKTEPSVSKAPVDTKCSTVNKFNPTLASSVPHPSPPPPLLPPRPPPPSYDCFAGASSPLSSLSNEYLDDGSDIESFFV